MVYKIINNILYKKIRKVYISDVHFNMLCTCLSLHHQN